MNELTLDELLRTGRSQYGQNDANYMLIKVSVEGNTPEVIINPKENFTTKLAYYEKAYNEDLTLKANPNIKIIGYAYVEDVYDLLQIVA